jgi:hypothetical protein
MATTHDLVVVTGKYTNKLGEQKNKHKNIGSMGTRDDGSIWIKLDRTFNPAGVPNEADSDSLFGNAYPIKSNGQQQHAPQQQAAPQQQHAPNVNFPDDNPFN